MWKNFVLLFSLRMTEHVEFLLQNECSTSFSRRKSFDDRKPIESNRSRLPHSQSLTNLINENENSLNVRSGNKFLQEIRSKRREFQQKAKHFTIDQRIKSYRRAQDVFSVHFHHDDDDDDEIEMNDDEFQEKKREEIFNELNRQRKKQFVKTCRNRFFARLLLFLAFFILLAMSCTLVSSVVHLIHRVENFNLTFFVNESNF